MRVIKSQFAGFSFCNGRLTSVILLTERENWVFEISKADTSATRNVMIFNLTLDGINVVHLSPHLFQGNGSTFLILYKYTYNAGQTKFSTSLKLLFMMKKVEKRIKYCSLLNVSKNQFLSSIRLLSHKRDFFF